MKRFALLIVVMVCLSLTAFAQDVPKGDVFGGFSIVHAPSVTSYGWQASTAANLHPVVGIVADFGGQYKNGTSGLQYLFGPRFNARMDKVTYFGEALYGGLRSSFDLGGTLGNVSSNNFAMAYGGGIDVKAGDKVLIRVIQFDWLPVKNGGTGGGWSKKNTRYGFGVVIPFGSK